MMRYPYFVVLRDGSVEGYAYACIGYPEKDDEYLTTNSADFHEHLGLKKVGGFYKCGYKFDRWYNMIWMEKIIGKHQEV